jgi:hypothetical protein
MLHNIPGVSNFIHCSSAHARANTHGYYAKASASASALHFVQQRCRHSSSCAAQGMAKCNGTAVGVHLHACMHASGTLRASKLSSEYISRTLIGRQMDDSTNDYSTSHETRIDIVELCRGYVEISKTHRTPMTSCFCWCYLAQNRTKQGSNIKQMKSWLVWPVHVWLTCAKEEQLESTEKQLEKLTSDVKTCRVASAAQFANVPVLCTPSRCHLCATTTHSHSACTTSQAYTMRCPSCMMP